MMNTTPTDAAYWGKIYYNKYMYIYSYKLQASAPYKQNMETWLWIEFKYIYNQ